ncbi:MAG: sigma-70 family RNA polymerase sigma factor [Candidatus Eisenbacteria bacterium]
MEWSDDRLVEGCLGGDARAWEVLVRRYERLVRAVAGRYRLPEAEAADAFQDTFAALVRGLPNLRDAKALCRWISSTAERISYASALRLRRDRARTSGSAELLAELPDTAPEGDSSLETLEAQSILRQALAAMPARCRALLEALYFEDPKPSYAEIARHLSMRVGSLGPTRARCFEQLRRGVEELGGAENLGIREEATRTYPTRKKDRPRSTERADSGKPGEAQP